MGIWESRKFEGKNCVLDSKSVIGKAKLWGGENESA